MARLLIAVAVAVMLASPFTESVTSFDNFPRGGQDCELSAFVILALLCLFLLTMLCGKGLSNKLLEARDRFLRHFRGYAPSLFSNLVRRSPVWTPPKRSPDYGAVALPLRI
jgi:hypothetical protein